jgi:hypothetical protein
VLLKLLAEEESKLTEDGTSAPPTHKPLAR